MAIGVVASSAFEQEMAALGINRDIEFVVNEEVRALVRGRGAKKETPMAVRALVASEATAGASSKELQEAFNVSPSSVSAYANGATSTSSYDKPEPEIVAAISETNNQINRIASSKILRALDAITDSKVADLTPLKAAELASRMSNVVKNTRIDPNERRDAGVKIVVFQPRVKEEDEYQVINILDE